LALPLTGTGLGNSIGATGRSGEEIAVTNAWNVLVVDDEPDIHSVTKLVLRRKTWKGRPIVLTSAFSGEEARAILAAPGCPLFHAALIDVVMESSDAGLRLCEYIRANFPPSLRIVLRTGQPGVAPEEAILTRYDIDYYLAKTEVTEERLYGTLRACFRNSQDMLGVLAMVNQLRSLASSVQDTATTMHTLVEIMNKSLEYLEEKYTVKLTFVQDVAGAANEAKLQRDGARYLDVARAIGEAHKAALGSMELHAGPPLGLAEGDWLVVMPGLTAGADSKAPPAKTSKITRWFTSVFDKAVTQRSGGVGVRLEGVWPPTVQHEFLLDLELFLTNWTLVQGLFNWERKASVDFLA
jgi:CheY-like chemotaxis protein